MSQRVYLPLLTGLGILVLWELAGGVGWIDPFMFSWPSQIGGSLIRQLASGQLARDFYVSGMELFFGLLLALIGIPLGLVIGYIRPLEYALDPYISALYATPIIALTPLFVIWFGLGALSKVMIIFLMAFFPICINTMAGVRTTDHSLLKAARSFGCSGTQIFMEVIVPSTVPFIVTGLRLAIGRALIAVVIGEFLAATAGLGFRIRTMAELFRTPEYLAAVTVILALAVLLTEGLRAVERRLSAWRPHD